MKKEDEKGEAEWVEEGRRHRKIEKKCTLKDGRKDGILAGVGVQYFDTPAQGGGHSGHGRSRGGAQYSGGQARYYAFPRRTEVVTSDAVVTCIISVCHKDASALFDLCSTYSYVSSYFASCLDMPRGFVDAPMHVSTHVGDFIMVDRVYQSCVVAIYGFDMREDFLLLDMVDFDVILGVDWLSPYHIILDYHARTVTLAMSGLPK
ncbi:uncharacterized protein [Nicotiana tomentosiformis]|uniref:uncharacterized protein n=1 Tax=Nicotiana tomentosiformis TaxID=4098 RepID=UPI00388C4CC8